ncbi:hypothetical protein [Actinoplanes utahensis]|uniref:Uncharacterized protein n=1 Tax=Actinoplanes utahensis TaxID=1869 RepID=A0A0A6UAX8_ACTUT|nr:hypothetical protein [Actinoplanes utahensis]KHD73195.1 hypothetical protein MB27_36870 [Actinoplanes utahensis]
MLPWPDGAPAPDLPAGSAGIAVRVRTGQGDQPRWPKIYAVGVDDRPMWHGLGRMVVLTGPGEHLVEIRDRFGVASMRRVRVADGQMARLEFWTPATLGSAEGVLAPEPVRHRIGAGPSNPVVFGFMAAGLIAMVFAGRAAPFVLAALAVPVLGYLVWARSKRRADDRYRVAASTEAAEAGRDDAPGWFLGDGSPPDGLAGDHGVLVVTGALRRTLTINGHGVLDPTGEAGAWVPWPELTVAGTPRPFSWRTWCYRLPAGEHELVVTARPPRTSVTVPEIDAEPFVRTVTITAGAVTRVDLLVTATVATRALTPAEVRRQAYLEALGGDTPDGFTEPARFTARITAA